MKSSDSKLRDGLWSEKKTMERLCKWCDAKYPHFVAIYSPIYVPPGHRPFAWNNSDFVEKPRVKFHVVNYVMLPGAFEPNDSVKSTFQDWKSCVQKKIIYSRKMSERLWVVLKNSFLGISSRHHVVEERGVNYLIRKPDRNWCNGGNRLKSFFQRPLIFLTPNFSNRFKVLINIPRLTRFFEPQYYTS